MSEESPLLEQLKKEKNPIIMGRILFNLHKKEGVKINDLAKIINKKPSALAHLIRLTKLPEAIIDGFLSQTVSLSHLYVISRLDREEEMIEVYEKVLSKNLTVAETEALVREKKYQIRTEGKYIDKNYIEKIKRIFEKEGFEVKIIQSRLRSRIIMTIKGNLRETSIKVKKILSALEKDFLKKKEGDS